MAEFHLVGRLIISCFTLNYYYQNYKKKTISILVGFRMAMSASRKIT